MCDIFEVFTCKHEFSLNHIFFQDALYIYWMQDTQEMGLYYFQHIHCALLLFLAHTVSLYYFCIHIRISNLLFCLGQLMLIYYQNKLGRHHLHLLRTTCPYVFKGRFVLTFFLGLLLFIFSKTPCPYIILGILLFIFSTTPCPYIILGLLFLFFQNALSLHYFMNPSIYIFQDVLSLHYFMNPSLYIF